MSKKRLSEADTVRLGLLKKGKTKWEFTTLTPSLVHKYLFQHGIRDLGHNPLTSKAFADWLRNSYPDDAVMFGLADMVKFSRSVRMGQAHHHLERTDVQYRDKMGNWNIHVMHPNCPAGLIEYVTTKYPQCIDERMGRVRSEIFMSEEFAKWVCRRDQDLAVLLGLGVRRAIRIADEA